MIRDLVRRHDPLISQWMPCSHLGSIAPPRRREEDREGRSSRVGGRLNALFRGEARVEDGVLDNYETAGKERSSAADETKQGKDATKANGRTNNLDELLEDRVVAEETVVVFPSGKDEEGIVLNSGKRSTSQRRGGGKRGASRTELTSEVRDSMTEVH